MHRDAAALSLASGGEIVGEENRVAVLGAEGEAVGLAGIELRAESRRESAAI